MPHSAHVRGFWCERLSVLSMVAKPYKQASNEAKPDRCPNT